MTPLSSVASRSRALTRARPRSTSLSWASGTAFEDEVAYEGVRKQFLKQAETLVEMGVEVIIPAGGLPMLLFSNEKDLAIGGGTVLNGITVATKAAKIAVKLHRIDGTSASRRSWFFKASPKAVQEFLQSP